MNTEQKTIMIVDDSPTVNTILKGMLIKEKYAVVACGNGLEAVEEAIKNPPNLIIMDSQMPRLDGFEATKKIRANPKTAGIPIIMISGSDQENEVKKALQAGADDYVAKPYEFNQLLNSIKKQLD